jgi:hypothetical protein
MRLFLLALILITCGSVPSQAACRSPADICEGIRYCAVVNLTDRNRVDRDRLMDAINRQDGNGIYSATEACQRNVGNIGDWQNRSAGCTSQEYQLLAQGLRSSGWTCARRERFYCYTQGRYYELDDLQCRGPRNDGAACMCNLFGQQSPGQVKRTTF